MDRNIFVIGAAITDWMGFPEGLPAPGDSVPGQIIKAPGGVGRNLAENLVKLGLRTELLTAFGDDADGKLLVHHCQDQGIGIRHSLVVQGQRGAIHLAIQDEKQDLYAGLADLQVLQAITPSYLQQQAGALADAKGIVLETNIPQESIEWLVAQEWEVPLYVDPVSLKLSQRVAHLLPHFHTIKANKRQAELLAGQSILRGADLETIADKWRDLGVERIFITLGSEGAFAADANSKIHIPAAKTTVANTTGAGDAFMAGLLWATERRWPLEDCCRAGLAASTLAVRAEGTISPLLNETSILEYIRKFC